MNIYKDTKYKFAIKVETNFEKSRELKTGKL